MALKTDILGSPLLLFGALFKLLLFLLWLGFTLHGARRLLSESTPSDRTRQHGPESFFISCGLEHWHEYSKWAGLYGKTERLQDWNWDGEGVWGVVYN